jgi:hypothetical protein
LTAYYNVSATLTLTPLKELDLLETPFCTAKVHVGKGSNTAPCGTDIYWFNGAYRSPLKVMPITLMSRAISHLLQDRSVIENLQHWRRDECQDAVEDPYGESHAPPTKIPDPEGAPEDVMYGVSDGAAWRSQAAYTSRYVTPGKTPGEIVTGPYVMRHSNLQYGLKLVLNLDW